MCLIIEVQYNMQMCKRDIVVISSPLCFYIVASHLVLQMSLHLFFTPNVLLLVSWSQFLQLFEK